MSLFGEVRETHILGPWAIVTGGLLCAYNVPANLGDVGVRILRSRDPAPSISCDDSIIKLVCHLLVTTAARVNLVYEVVSGIKQSYVNQRNLKTLALKLFDDAGNP